MQIKRLSVNHFGKLNNLTVTLKDGINVISGKNESGKSTLHSFTEAMFFGLERGRGRAAKDDAYTHFIPWNGGTYGGAIEVEKDGKTYCVSRNFSRDAKSFSVRNETDSRNLISTEETLSEIFGGLTPPLYRNTISVGQLGAGTGSSLSGEVKNRIVNLQSSGASDVDVIKAVELLKSEKKRIYADYRHDAMSSREEFISKKYELEKELENDTSAFEMAKVEAEKADSSEKIMLYEKEKSRLNTVISENEELLKNNRVVDSDDIDSLSNDVGLLTDEISYFRDRHSICCKKAAKPVFFALMIILAALFAGAVFYVFRIFKKTGLTDWHPYIPAAPIALALLILFIIFLINVVRTARYSGLKKEFIRHYKLLFGQNPEVINSLSIDRLMREPQKLSDTIKTIKTSREKLSETEEKLGKEKEKFEGILSRLELIRKLDQQREQKKTELIELESGIEDLDDIIRKNSEISTEVMAIDKAIENITDISENHFESMGSELEEAVSCILGSMTSGAYSGVQIDDNLNVTLLADGRRVDLSSVSTGTLDQVYLALRLACIEFFWPDEKMPLILDDTFAMYDSDRLSGTLAWLDSFYEGQIIIFSCHTREHEILEELGIKHNLVIMP